jgi:hypothetical protein
MRAKRFPSSGLNPAGGPTSRMTEAIENMSADEKFRLVEALWDSLSREEARLGSRPWHNEALQETVARHQVGQDQPIDWDRIAKARRVKVVLPNLLPNSGDFGGRITINLARFVAAFAREIAARELGIAAPAASPYSIACLIA